MSIHFEIAFDSDRPVCLRLRPWHCPYASHVIAPVFTDQTVQISPSILISFFLAALGLRIFYLLATRRANLRPRPAEKK